MEIKSQKKQVLPLICITDTSGSMSNCIEELITSTNNMINSLKTQESLRAEVHVSFVTFGGNSRLHTPLTPINSIDEVRFEASGMTPLGGALKIAKNMIEDRDIVPSDAFRPMVVLLSDGYPTDDYETVLDDFINDGRSKKCERFSLGIGNDYDYDMLKSFSTSGDVFEAKDANNLVDFFKFVTMTLKEKSLSSNPNKTASNSLKSYKENTIQIFQEKTDKIESQEIQEKEEKNLSKDNFFQDILDGKF